MDKPQQPVTEMDKLEAIDRALNEIRLAQQGMSEEAARRAQAIAEMDERLRRVEGELRRRKRRR